MTIMRWSATVFASLLVLSLTAAEPQPIPRATPASLGLSSAPLDEATELLDRFVAEKKIAGAVAAVARRGTLAYLEPVGVQDLETRARRAELARGSSARRRSTR